MKRSWVWKTAIALVLAFIGLYVIHLAFGTYVPRKSLGKLQTSSDNDEFITLDSGVTHYTLNGPDTGEKIVLVHGLSWSSRTWDNQINHLVDRGYRVLSYDLYGHGLSSRIDGPYTTELFLKQLSNLTAHLNFKNFHLVGLSMGGGLSVAYTEKFPNTVRKLALIAPAGMKTKLSVGNWILTRAGIGEIFLWTLGDWYFLYQTPRSLASDVSYRRELRKLYRYQVQYPGFRRAVLSSARHGPVLNLLQSYKTIGNSNRKVMLIWGMSDQVLPPSMIPQFKKYIPQADVVRVSQAGHDLTMTHPETVNMNLSDFLNTSN